MQWMDAPTAQDRKWLEKYIYIALFIHVVSVLPVHSAIISGYLDAIKNSSANIIISEF